MLTPLFPLELVSFLLLCLSEKNLLLSSPAPPLHLPLYIHILPGLRSRFLGSVGNVFLYTFPYLSIAGVIGAPQMTLQPVLSIFSVLYRPLELCDLQACPFPDVVFPPLLLFALSSSNPLTVPSKVVLARPNELETSPYHFSLRLFTMVRGSSCGWQCT